MSDHLQDQVIKAITNGKIIQAIKILRTVENLSLSEAKDKVEAIAASINSFSNNNQQLLYG